MQSVKQEPIYLPEVENNPQQLLAFTPFPMKDIGCTGRSRRKKDTIPNCENGTWAASGNQVNERGVYSRKCRSWHSSSTTRRIGV